MYNLSGKVAIVTGAGGRRGFGKTIAVRLAAEGADVVAVDRVKGPVRNADKTDGWKGLDSVVEEVEALERRCLAIACDVTQSQEVDRMVSDVVAKFDKIDILVNNAGIQVNSGVLELTDELWNKHLAVNLTGMFYCCRAIARQMVKQGKGGRIINIGSMWSKIAIAGNNAAYCASKFGVIGLTQSLAMELAGHNILVNAVCPAMTDTGFHAELAEQISEREGITIEEAGKRIQQQFDRVAATFPLKRLGTAADVANMVAFLASDQADFITGQAINVNGGALMAH